MMKKEYTCPMHLQIVQTHPGSCPICGMALESRTGDGPEDEENAELKNMSLRFWIGLILTLPILLIVLFQFLSPIFFMTGKGSPVIIDSSIELLPSIILPSVGIFSPGLTRNLSPFLTSSNGMSFSFPSS